MEDFVNYSADITEMSYKLAQFEFSLSDLDQYERERRASQAWLIIGLYIGNLVERQLNYGDVIPTRSRTTTNTEVDSTVVSAKVAGRGHSKGGHQPENLKEQLAVESAMSNPSDGKELKFNKEDPRWPTAEGWTKRAQHINGVEVHYQYNTKTGQIDDFKIKDNIINQ